jgi:hypothetical protein
MLLYILLHTESKKPARSSQQCSFHATGTRYSSKLHPKKLGTRYLRAIFETEVSDSYLVGPVCHVGGKKISYHAIVNLARERGLKIHPNTVDIFGTLDIFKTTERMVPYCYSSGMYGSSIR